MKRGREKERDKDGKRKGIAERKEGIIAPLFRPR